MICTVTSSLIGQSVIKRFCVPAWIKLLRKPITPSPARASPEPVSHAERVTNQVPCKSKLLTSSAVRIPSFSTGGTSSCSQASIVVWKTTANRRLAHLQNVLKTYRLRRWSLSRECSAECKSEHWKAKNFEPVRSCIGSFLPESQPGIVIIFKLLKEINQFF